MRAANQASEGGPRPIDWGGAAPGQAEPPYIEVLRMQAEDLHCSYLRLESAYLSLFSEFSKVSNSLKSARQKALLTVKLDTFSQQTDGSSDFLDFSGLKTRFYDLTVTYWLLARERSPADAYLSLFVKSILGDTDVPVAAQGENDGERLVEIAAKLRKERNQAQFSVQMCKRTVNRLSQIVSQVYGVQLPKVGGQPDLEVPEVCEAIVRAVAMTSGEWRLSNFLKRPELKETIEPYFEESYPRQDQLELEGLAFERDLYKRQVQLLKEIYREKRAENTEIPTLDRISAKEAVIKAQLEQLLKEKSEIVLLSSRISPFTLAHDCPPYLKPTLQSPLQTASSSASTPYVSPRRSPSDLQSPLLRVPRVIASAERVLQSTHRKLDAIDREWRCASQTRLISSMIEKKESVSPRNTHKLASLYIPTVGEGQKEKPESGEKRKRDGSSELRQAWSGGERQERFRQPTTRTLKSAKNKVMAPS